MALRKQIGRSNDYVKAGQHRNVRCPKPKHRDSKTNEVMENLSALEPRHVLCAEPMLFDMQNGTWFVETIRASGKVRTKQAGHKTASDNHKSHQQCLC
jgi:hypothetical protein